VVEGHRTVRVAQGGEVKPLRRSRMRSVISITVCIRRWWSPLSKIQECPSSVRVSIVRYGTSRPSVYATNTGAGRRRCRANGGVNGMCLKY
jgi:hypothetical protein